MLDRVVRVFVSSTFKDMRQERDVLHGDRVRGELRRMCEAQGFQFQLIDLRWGISAEAAWDQRTEPLCLDEIRRCRELSPRPNFVALVGQRYGWRPLPQLLTRSDWRLACRVAGDSLALLQDWYRPDHNNAPPVFRLRPRWTEAERDPAGWGRIEGSLRALLMRCLETYPARVSQSIALADKSLTEKEIVHGAENAVQADWQAFAYFRDIEGKRRDELDEPFVDLDEAGRLVDPRSGEKLDSLRQRLAANPKVTTRRLLARAVDGSVDDEYLEQLSTYIYQDLFQAIGKQLEAYAARDPLQKEIEKHREFAGNRTRNFVARSGDERRVMRYVASPSRTTPLVIAAPSGAGKTALLARASQLVERKFPRCIAVSRYIGVTGDSSALRPLVRSIHDEVARRAGVAPLPSTFDSQPIRLLGETLRAGTAERPVVIFLDALDQLAADDHARQCNWLPVRLPENAKVVATVMSYGPDEELSDVFKSVSTRLPGRAIGQLQSMKAADLTRMFDMWLGSVGRAVSAAQAARIRSAIEAHPRPLFVRLLAELARGWTAEQAITTMPGDIQAAVGSLLDDLEQDSRHGAVRVGATLALLAASRAGLTEPELIDLLGKNESVLDDFRARGRYDYDAAKYGLPPILWSSLLLDLDLFLGHSSAIGTSLIAFYHRQLAHAVRTRYARSVDAAAATLADYFEAQPPFLQARDFASSSPHVRRAFELCFQLRAMGDGQATRDRLARILTDQPSVEAKALAALEKDLLEDYFQLSDEHNTNRLAGFLASFLLAASPGAERLAPESVQAYLAYLRKSQGSGEEGPSFYWQLLETLIAPNAAPELSPQGRRRVARGRISLGEQYRRARQHETARKLLGVLDDDGSGLLDADRATGWYERAYIEYLEDNYDVAVEYFDRSTAVAEKTGDAVGAVIPYGPRQWAAYFLEPTDRLLQQGIEMRARSAANLQGA
jgi:NACHT domain- and WD repeat-containing protein